MAAFSNGENFLLLGDSYVNHLGISLPNFSDAAVERDYHVFDKRKKFIVKLPDFRIDLIGFSGFDTRKLMRSLDCIDFRGYNKVILFVGGNDISSNSVSVLSIADAIMEIGRRILFKGVPKVLIFSLLGRLNPSGCTEQDFNTLKGLINQELSKRAQSVDGIHFYHNTGGCFPARSHYDKDGVHLNDTGNKKWWGKLLHAKKF